MGVFILQWFPTSGVRVSGQEGEKGVGGGGVVRLFKSQNVPMPLFYDVKKNDGVYDTNRFIFTVAAASQR